MEAATFQLRLWRQQLAPSQNHRACQISKSASFSLTHSGDEGMWEFWSLSGVDCPAQTKYLNACCFAAQDLFQKPKRNRFSLCSKLSISKPNHNPPQTPIITVGQLNHNASATLYQPFPCWKPADSCHFLPENASDSLQSHSKFFKCLIHKNHW